MNTDSGKEALGISLFEAVIELFPETHTQKVAGNDFRRAKSLARNFLVPFVRQGCLACGAGCQCGCDVSGHNHEFVAHVLICIVLPPWESSMSTNNGLTWKRQLAVDLFVMQEVGAISYGRIDLLAYR